MFLLTQVALLITLVASLPHQLSPLPPRADVRQEFLFFSTGPFTLFFQDTFCPGLATLIWDNDLFLGTTPSRQNFCGISASGFTSAIISPQFTSGSYDMLAGFHNLTILVYASPTPNGKATVSINLFPLPGTQIIFKSILKERVSLGEYKNLIGKGLISWINGPMDIPSGSIPLLD